MKFKSVLTKVAIGRLFGGLTGATNELDKSGRTSAVIGFVTATAGLILSTISLVAALPSGESSTITLVAEIKLVIAGIFVGTATVGTVSSGYKAVKTFTFTDGPDIDWDNINWDKVGVSAAEKAIGNAADEYMWGSIIGVVHGGAEEFDFYQKFNTPYTKYNARLMKTPKEGSGGKWSGDRGESDFILDEPITLADGAELSAAEVNALIDEWIPRNASNRRVFEAKSKPAKFSGGGQRLLSVLSVIATRPNADLIIVDEPLNNLDFVNTRNISNMLNRVIRSNPKAVIIMVSHCRIFPFITRELKVTPDEIIEELNTYTCHSCFGNPDEKGFY